MQVKKSVALLVCLTATAACTSSRSTSTPTSSATTAPPVEYAAARSIPDTDSVYPAYGTNNIDALHYGLALDWDPRRKVLSGTTTLRFRVARATDRVKLDLGDPLKVSSATLDGRKVGRSRSHNTVTFATGSLPAGSIHTLTAVYAGTPATVPWPSKRPDAKQGLGFHQEEDGTAWAMQEPYGAFTWYPVNDEPGDKAFYDATLTAHDGQRGVFNGVQTATATKTGTTTSRFHLDQPAASYLTTVAFGKYVLEKRRLADGKPLMLWYPQGTPKGSLPALRRAPQTIGYLSTLLGPYPFASAGVLLIPTDAAMETQTLVTISGQDTPEVTFQDVILAHEFAHQWVGDAVTPHDWRDLFLSESLAQLLQDKYAEHVGFGHLDAAVKEASDRDQELRTQAGPPGAYQKDHFGEDNVYKCGEAMLGRMAKAYGPKFWAAVKSWPTVHRNGNVTRDDFIDHFSKSIGVDLRPWITTWLTSPTTPTAAPPKTSR